MDCPNRGEPEVCVSSRRQAGALPPNSSAAAGSPGIMASHRILDGALRATKQTSHGYARMEHRCREVRQKASAGRRGAFAGCGRLSILSVYPCSIRAYPWLLDCFSFFALIFASFDHRRPPKCVRASGRLRQSLTSCV